MKVYVYPDGEQYSQPPTWKSDDYEVRDSGFCNTCDSDILPIYNEPYAACLCGIIDWDK